MVGFSPFYVGSTNDNYKMFDLIKSKPAYFPDHIKHGISMSSKCKDFITIIHNKLKVFPSSENLYFKCVYNAPMVYSSFITLLIGFTFSTSDYL